jgi:dGTPase
MSDQFYGSLDRECLRNDFNPERKSDYRSIFHQDRDRILFTPAFRRLQAKTQVFQAGEYDFYRTRLTHSLEVSRIAESIAVWLRASRPEVQVDFHLLEGICLAHDIGHPPFGHAGERALNELMSGYGGFEGNAQTLRILTRTIYSDAKSRMGMSPSRALLDGVLKYKRLHRDRAGASNHFIYDDQADVLAFCFGTADLAAELGGGGVNEFQSLECQIMDLADDIAYSCFDLVDGAKARFLTADKIEEWRAARGISAGDLEWKYLDELLEMMAKRKLQSRMNLMIGDLIKSASAEPRENFMTSRTRRHAFRLVRPPEAQGGRILRQLAEVHFGNYLENTAAPSALLPQDVHRAVVAAPGKPEAARLLCDHLSGMTDAYAVRSYKRLLDPEYGSISELI